MELSLRYNFRNPPQWALPSAQLYNLILDQIEWAESAGFYGVNVSEHHFLDEAFLPSLLPVCAAIASRTKTIRIGTELLLLPLHHPVRLAEDAAIVDIISNGRFQLMVGAGYREEEYAALGMKLRQRGGRMEECLQIIKKCWTEEEFSFDGRYYQLSNVRMMPKPVQPGGPRVIVGAASEAAARRAARLADGICPMEASLWEAYYDELEKLGKPAPRKPIPPPGPILFHVTEDPEKDWQVIRQHGLYELTQYQNWGMDDADSFGDMQSSDETLRHIYQIWTPDEAREHLLERQANFPDDVLSFTPIAAGMHPDMAQSSLELIAKQVLPALRSARQD